MDRNNLIVLFLAASAGTTCAQYNPASLGDPPVERPVYWCVTNNQHPHERWAEEIDFCGADISRDVVILYQWKLGRFPYIGPHRHRLDSEWMDSHLAKLRQDVEYQIPDPDFSGLAIIDYEHWSLNWERTRNKPGDRDPFAIDQDYQDDWREYIRAHRSDLLRGLNQGQQEQVFKETYEECAKEIYLATLAECRALRPNAQWSFFAYPVLRYKFPRELPQGVIGYDDLTHDASRLNDELTWLWEAVDFICPAIYAPRVTIPEGQRRAQDGTEDWPSQFSRFVSSNAAEAARVGGDKPVYPCITMHYTIPELDFPWLNDRNLQISFQDLLKGEHADGVIIWGNINSEQYASDLQDYMRDHLVPTLLSVEPTLGDDGDDGQGQRADADDSGRGDDATGGVRRTVGDPAKKASTARKSRFPFHFQSGEGRVSKPTLTRSEASQARLRAKKVASEDNE